MLADYCRPAAAGSLVAGRPHVRREGKLAPSPWSEVIPAVRQKFLEAATKDPSKVIGVLSPFLTCEEAFLLAKFLKGMAASVRLALAPVPVVGDDDTYPKDRRGRPIQPVKFTIRGEKCPNRRGVEENLRHFQGEIIPFTEVVREDVAKGHEVRLMGFGTWNLRTVAERKVKSIRGGKQITIPAGKRVGFTVGTVLSQAASGSQNRHPANLTDLS